MDIEAELKRISEDNEKILKENYEISKRIDVLENDVSLIWERIREK